MSQENQVSAAQRFASRSRPAVAPRVEEIHAAVSAAATAAPVANPEPAPVAMAEPGPGSTLEQLEAELAKFPDVERLQLRVEPDCAQQLKQLAQSHKVTPETLVQGIWSVISKNPDLLGLAVEEAVRGKERRDRVMRLRSLISQLSKLSKSS